MSRIGKGRTTGQPPRQGGAPVGVDSDEREAIAAFDRTRGDETVPHEMVKRLAADENPIKLWREHRGMTLAQLGEAIGKQKGYLSEIESGKKPGTVETLRAIAKALRVDLDDIA